MSDLKSLKFTTIPKVEDSPVMNRRAKLIERLEEQKQLVSEPSFTRTVQRWLDKDGEKVPVERRIKVHPWWRTDEKGSVVFFIRHGWKPIEFEKGKAGIVVGPKEKLASVIDTLIAATRNGEMDELLRSAASATKPKRQT